MKFIADFHIHSRFSRATSKEINPANLAKWAQIKGIKVLGTGDFTHPLWLKELKENLEPAESGLYKLKHKAQNTKHKNNGFNNINAEETRFILTSEISCIYSKNNRVRKVHILIISPTFEAVEKINNRLEWIGNLKSDGRPILGLDAKELLKIVLQLSPASVVVPAHCLLPETNLHLKEGVKPIQDVIVGDFVYTHKGRIKKVKDVLKRTYRGRVYTIKPSYFRIGLTTTPEHPYLAIPNDRYKGRSTYYGEQLKREYFQNEISKWIPAKELKIGDILLFPRFRKIKDKKLLDLIGITGRKQIKVKGNKIAPIGSKITWLPRRITINKELCRLIGYYLAEGYTNNRDAITFCFSGHEKEYISDLKFLMQRIFGIKPSRISSKRGVDGVEIIYFSKVLYRIFNQLFYDSSVKRAYSKALPPWALELSLRKQVEIFRGWWRGDSGLTVSRTLMNQMKTILLRLGIIPSIHIDTKGQYAKRGKHFIGKRKISARHDLFSFSNLSFFEDKFSLLKEKEFKKWNYKTIKRNGWIDKNYVYLPIRNIEKTNYRGEVFNLEIEKDNSYVSEFATIHNCWTPWFALFGSKSGFDSLEECFEEYSKYIFAIESGLSSDPAMNWRLSGLDRLAIISNSDSHSLQKIGREANVFDTTLDYRSIIEAIKEKNPKKFLYTIEFFPEEGKYHFDGHRLCNICFSPQESKKNKGICPQCHRPLTIGVLNRVEELADRPVGGGKEGKIPFRSLVPLGEIISEALGVASVTKKTMEEYENLIRRFGNEFAILLEAGSKELMANTLPEIAEGIIRVREGKVKIEPGYDGVYGKVRFFGQGEQQTISKQKSLF